MRILLLLFCLFVIIVCSYGMPSDEEREALIEFYNSLNGKNWKKNKWNIKEKNVCKWRGVSCDTKKNSVVELELERSNLKGSIPKSINKLKNLVLLDVGGNQISGSLPELNELESLRTFEAHHNKFEGRIPESYGAIFARGGRVIVAKNQRHDGKWHFDCPYPSWMGAKAGQTGEHSHARLMGVPEECGLTDKDNSPQPLETEANDEDSLQRGNGGGGGDEDGLLQEAIPDRKVRRKPRGKRNGKRRERQRRNNNNNDRRERQRRNNNNNDRRERQRRQPRDRKRKRRDNNGRKRRQNRDEL